jgi:hypothetical protein
MISVLLDEVFRVAEMELVRGFESLQLLEESSSKK